MPRSLVLLVALAACTDSDEPASVSRVELFTLPILQPRQIDFLFVIDNSPRMAGLQPNLLANYPQLINSLYTLEGGLPSVRFAVITTDFEVRGPLVDERFIDGTHRRNYSGDLRDAFTQLADVGASGASHTQPLEAMRRGLAIPSFLRDRELAVVFVTAQDDGSPDSVDSYEQALRATRRDQSKIFVAGALGPDLPTADALVTPCALPAPRLHALLRRFPDRTTSVALCQQDLTGVLSLFGQLLRPFAPDPCVHAELAEPLECAFEYVAKLEDALEDARPLDPCDRGVVPCWQIISDAVQCPHPPAQRLAITHAPIVLPEHVLVRGACLAR